MAHENHASPLVEFRDVSFSVERGPAIINQLSLEIHRGETFVLLGESGCGKTTTLRLVNRLLMPTSGEVLVEEKSTVAWDPARVRARVDELLALVGLEPQKFADRYPRELSGGQRQRVGVARALAADPPILLMDEPFGALDPVTRAQLQREFQALQQRLKKTVVFVTHDLREALLLGTRIALMENGRLIVTLTPDEFLHSTEPAVRLYIDAFGANGTCFS